MSHTQRSVVTGPAALDLRSRALLELQLRNLFQREQVWSKFATQKRMGLVRGDQVWQIAADPAKAPGRRLSVYEVDPASYFPISDAWNPEKVTGVHLVDPVLLPDGKTVIKRQTYRKEDIRSDCIRVRTHTTEKVISAPSGTLIATQWA